MHRESRPVRSTCPPRCACALRVIVFALAVPTTARAQTAAPLDSLLDRFWRAETTAQAEALIPAIIATGAPFDTLYARLRAGPHHAAGVPVGRLTFERKGSDGLLYRYFIRVPEDYDPARRYPVVFYLHGGIDRSEWRAGEDWWPRPVPPGPPRIEVYPAGWQAARWWDAGQVENLHAILDALKRTYNVDVDRVHVLGVSDGATGVYFLALRDITPWAGFVALIGHPAVLANPDLHIEGELFAANIANRPLLAMNVARDPLYPARSVAPYISLFRSAGGDIAFDTVPGDRHGVRWWPEHAARIDSFMAATPREPNPARVVWQTGSPERNGRAAWVRIVALDTTSGPPPKDHNSLVRTEDGQTVNAFPHHEPSGRVVAERNGNTITVRTAGVTAVQLLLSPDVFDFKQPFMITVNGRRVADRKLTPDPRTLLHEAARDRDPHLLYGMAVTITVQP